MTTFTFNSYTKMPLTLNFQEMQTIHAEILSEIDGDEDALELYEDLVRQSVKYAAVRGNWSIMTLQEKIAVDASRTSCHNSLIIKFNQLERYLKMLGKPARWRDKIGRTEENPQLRKKIGDMGCYIAFVHGICSR